MVQLSDWGSMSRPQRIAFRKAVHARLWGDPRSSLPVTQAQLKPAPSVNHVSSAWVVNTSIPCRYDLRGPLGSLSISLIRRVVAEHYGLSQAELLSVRRSARLVRARQVAMYLARELTSHSLPVIGDHIGGRDHTTIIHAIRKIEGLIKGDGDFRLLLDELRQRIQGAAGAG